jgi:hypothetical protein
MGLRSICSCSPAHLKAALTARIRFRRWFWLMGRSVLERKFFIEGREGPLQAAVV